MYEGQLLKTCQQILWAGLLEAASLTLTHPQLNLPSNPQAH
jgi:hypothetical protein